MAQEELPRRGFQPFYFDNPGVHFYSLADTLLRQIGRKDFAKQLFELAGVHADQGVLFGDNFDAFLREVSRKRDVRDQYAGILQNRIMDAKITEDEEIAMRLAQIVVDLPKKPYFEYRDFVAGRRDSLVPQQREPEYFNAILNVMRLAGGVDSVAFLVDEFEDISLQTSLSKRQAQDYLVTMRRLFNLASSQNLLTVLSLTPDGANQTQSLMPALWERFTAEKRHVIELEQLTGAEASDLVRQRLKEARAEGFTPPNGDEFYPLFQGFTDCLARATRSSPRRLVKVCYHAVERAARQGRGLSCEELNEEESGLYPPEPETKARTPKAE